MAQLFWYFFLDILVSSKTLLNHASGIQIRNFGTWKQVFNVISKSNGLGIYNGYQNIFVYPLNITLLTDVYIFK